MKKMKLAAFVLAFSMTAALCGCGQSSMAGSNENTDAAETQAEETQTTETQAEETESGPMTLHPLDASVDLNDLADCTVAVSFTADSFNWMGSTVTAEIYDTLLYDAVEVSQLKEGDTIDLIDSTVEVKTLTDGEMGIVINEGEDDEITLATDDEGGVYYISGYDDQRMQRDLGQAELILSQDLVLNDSAEDPQAVKNITSDEIKSYLEGLTEPYNTFDQTSTTAVIENGEVIEIDRVWIP